MMMSRLLRRRYKFFGTYKVDKWIIQSCMLLVFAYLFFVAYHYDIKK